MKRACIIFNLFSSLILAQGPTIISTYPAQNALNVPLDTTITVTFDKDINPGSLNASTFVVRASQTGILSGTYSYDPDTYTATFTPAKPFKAGEVLSVTVTTSVQSIASDTLAKPYIWSFTVETTGGSGRSVFTTSYSVGRSDPPRSIIPADLNGDENLDLAAAYYRWSGDISVLLNRGAEADIALSVDTLSFVSTQINTGVTRAFTIDNHGLDSTLTVDGIISSSPVFASYPSSLLVPPGKSATVIVIFTPLEAAAYSGILTITSNDPQRPEVTIKLTGNVITLNPPLNALNVATDTPIAATFSYDINPAIINSGTFVVNASQTGLVSGSNSYDPGTYTASFTPDRPFKPGEQVNVTLTEGIADAAGAAIVSPYAWSFTIAATGGSAMFSEQTGHAAEYFTPGSVAAADLDRDGDVDLAAASDSANKIRVFLNSGKGLFPDSTTIGYAWFNYLRPVSLIACDLDGERDLELALADPFYNTIWIFNTYPGYLNPSGTHFDRYNPRPEGSGPFSITTADFDGDCVLDLASANSGSANLSVLIGTGNGRFAPQKIYQAGGEPRSITSAHLNDDGVVDLVVANYSSDNISVLLGNGDGTFAAQTIYPAGEGPHSIAAADLDRDGDLDLATANYDSNSISILLGNGDGTFAAKTTYAAGDGPSSIVAADLDGDGDADLATANYNADNLSVLMGFGNGTFAAQTTYTVGDRPYCVVPADFDGDGDLDLATANRGSDNITILFNNDIFSAHYSLDAHTVYSDTITICYTISNPGQFSTGLLCEYSPDGGTTWQPASVIGDTSGLSPENYKGILEWDSGSDLPAIYDPAVRLRITPYDQTGRGRSFVASPFYLDNDHDPVANITPIYVEQSGDVTIQYTLSDDEGDTLSFIAKYSGDRGKSWQVATITGINSALAPDVYTGSLVWHTLTDLPDHEDSLTYFRIMPYDNEAGIKAVLILHVDNNEPPTLVLDAITIDTVVSRLMIPYTLSDLENDTLSIAAAYSLDQGQTWQLSAVERAGRAVTPANYVGEVAWLAFAGLHGKHEGVQLQLVPYDYDPGVGDTIIGLTVINYPGDYTGDLNITTNDLALFAAAWNAEPQDLAYEIGPAPGSVPDLLPQPDGLLDFEDLTVFLQMWNWSFANNGFLPRALAKATVGKPSIRLVQRMPEDLWSTETSDKVTVDLFLEGTPELMMIDGLLAFDPQVVRFAGIEDGGYLGQYYQVTPLFVNVSPDSSQVLFAIVGLGPAPSSIVESTPVATLTLELRSRSNEVISVDYVLKDASASNLEAQTAAVELQPLLPAQFSLHQNFPNPFNPTTTIRLELPISSKVLFVVYDILGREVITLKDEYMDAGYQQVVWHGKDSRGRDLASGIYIARLVTPVYTKSIKMLLLK